MHGGASTGPRSAEGIERIRQARTVHGRYSAEMTRLRALLAECREVERMAKELDFQT
jgi:hypothetical protein